MGNEHHDVVIIGTSPLAITEAVWQKSKGKSVINIDDKETAGGAWTTIKHKGIPEVEIGCHIWEVEKRATDFLETFYGLNLVPLKPQPRLLKKGMSIPYDWKMNLMTSKYIVLKNCSFQIQRIKGRNDFSRPDVFSCSKEVPVSKRRSKRIARTGDGQSSIRRVRHFVEYRVEQR